MTIKKTGKSGVKVAVYKAESDMSTVLAALLQGGKKEVGDLLQPPIDLNKLGALHDLSALLRPNIDSYATNIDAQGHHFEPALDLNAPDADERVRDAMFVEQLIKAQLADTDIDAVVEPQAEEITKKIGSLRRRARLELARARAFFTTCTPDGTFTDLRVATRQDVEMTGNGYWEVLRDSNQLPTALYRVPAVSMRISRDITDVPVRVQRQITDLSWEQVNVRRSFRRFAQVDDAGTPVVWFREFGDPRIVSRQTGNAYATIEALKQKEGAGADAATEVLHFEVGSIVSTYGLPRWLGNMPSVLGSRELDETNLDYFLSNAVPALALLVSGGKLGRETKERLKEFFEQDVRGRRANHKLVVLEAERPRGPSGAMTKSPTIDFVPLRNAQMKDALFLGYDERNAQKISASFRLPVSFMTGKASLDDLRLADEQVFQPARDQFDAKINKFLMPALKVQFWQFCSNSSMTRNPEVVGKLALEFGKAGFLLPAEVRKLGSRVFRENLPAIRDRWAAVPMPFTLAAFGLRASPAEAVREQGRQQGDPAQEADDLLSQAGMGGEDQATIAPRGPEDVDDHVDDATDTVGDTLAALPGLVAQARAGRPEHTDD